MVKSFLPPMSSDQLPIQASSPAAAIAARPAATFLSNRAKSSSFDDGTGSGAGGLPSGAISNSSRVKVSLHQPGRPAKWAAYQPIVPDFGCAFQLILSKGTRSRVL